MSRGPLTLKQGWRCCLEARHTSAVLPRTHAECCAATVRCPALPACLPAAELHPSSLAFVALWGLLDSALAATCGGAVGAWVDRQPRMVAAARMYLLQNCCVAASAATALALLLSEARSGLLYWLGLAMTMAAGSASTLGALGSTLSGQHSRAQQGGAPTSEWRQPACAHRRAALNGLHGPG